MKKLILAITLLGSITAYAAEYKVKIENNLFDYNGSLYGRVLEAGNKVLVNKNVRIVPVTVEAYEQFRSIQSGNTISIKGSSEYEITKGLFSRINAISVSE